MNFKLSQGKVDLLLAGAVILLIMFGQLMVFSASSVYAQAYKGSMFYFFQRQFFWGLLAIIMIIVFSKINYSFLKNVQISIFLISLSIIMLIAVLFVGKTINGATRWFSFGFASFQPVEIARIAIIVYLAHKLSKPEAELDDFKKGFLPFLLIIGVITFLVMIQPDLSSSLMICFITLTMILVSRVKLVFLGYLTLPLAPLLIFFFSLKTYQLSRITNWLKSFGDPIQAAYQVKQSAIGIGRGGFWGEGLGESKQKLFFLPDSHTDFIFSIIGEEFGFIGTIFILSLFILILVRGLRIAKNAPDGFGQFLAFGITMNICLYAFINVAVTTNLVPATGLPMPFVSYGGSNMLFMGISMGLLLNLSRQVKRHVSQEEWEEFQTQRGRFQSSILEID